MRHWLAHHVHLDAHHVRLLRVHAKLVHLIHNQHLLKSILYLLPVWHLKTNAIILILIVYLLVLILHLLANAKIVLKAQLLCLLILQHHSLILAKDVQFLIVLIASIITIKVNLLVLNVPRILSQLILQVLNKYV